MKGDFMLVALSLLLVFNISSFIKQNGVSIDDLYIKLAKGRNINYQEIEGRFIYSENNENRGKYVAKFSGNKKKVFHYTCSVFWG